MESRPDIKKLSLNFNVEDASLRKKVKPAPSEQKGVAENGQPIVVQGKDLYGSFGTTLAEKVNEVHTPKAAMALSPVGPDRQQFKVHNAPVVQSVRGQLGHALVDNPIIAISETQLGHISEGRKNVMSEFLSLEMATKQQDTGEQDKDEYISDTSGRILHEDLKKDGLDF